MRRFWRWLTGRAALERRLDDIEQALRDIPAYVARTAAEVADVSAARVQSNLDRLDVNVTRHVRDIERAVNVRR